MKHNYIYNTQIQIISIDLSDVGINKKVCICIAVTPDGEVEIQESWVEDLDDKLPASNSHNNYL